MTFLDISTMDAGDIDFSPLENSGHFEHFPTTSPAQVVERLSQTEVAIVNKVVLGKAEIAACPKLKLIQLSATGYNNIDLDAARAHGVAVCNVSGYSTETVAQHTIGLLINLATSIHLLAGEAGRWPASPIFSRLDYPALELHGKTLGIAGSGAIGSRVADIASALGMNIQFLAREDSTNPASPDRPKVGVKQFFSTSDAISLHCPLTPQTHHMINAQTLRQMKAGAFLLNTGRGDLVNETDLAVALEQELIAGAGLDVLSKEPPASDHPLIKLAERLPRRLIITPHSAWSSVEARTRLIEGMATNIRNWLAGTLTNEVS
ncbi:MAG: glycerate dehydrogenase [Pseudoalteromonas tetraodonis]